MMLLFTPELSRILGKGQTTYFINYDMSQNALQWLLLSSVVQSYVGANGAHWNQWLRKQK